MTSDDSRAAADELLGFVVGPIQTNCYAYVSDGRCMVVDAGFAGAALAERLRDVDVDLVVSTHGHGDHTGGVAELVAATGAPFALCPADCALALSTTGDGHHPGELVPPEPDRDLADGDVLSVGTATFRVIAAPGHTPGGVVLLGGGSAEGVAFVGDTLFAGSAGRTDLAGGDHAALMATLRRLREEVPPATRLLCGHGPATTMARELAENPFLMGA